MSDVYEVIDAIRIWRGMSMREVAQNAKITYTTIASLMSRRSPYMSKETLVRMALALNVIWFKMLNCDSADETAEIYTGRYSSEPRVKTELSEQDVRQALKKIIGEDYETFLKRSREKVKLPVKSAVRENMVVQETHQDPFRRSIDLMLDKLNEEGLMEAMRHLLDIAKEPMYCKATDTKREENE